MATISTLTSVYNFFTNSDTKELTIPMYQRKYSWEKDQINDFLLDLENLINNPKQNKYHFFGLIVLCESDPNLKRFEIIDGQQRITTIYLVLAILRDLINDLTFHSDILRQPQILEDLNNIKSGLNSCLTNLGNLKLTTLNEALYESDYLKIILGKITDLSQDYTINYSSQSGDNKNSFEIKIKALSETPRFDQRIGKSKALRKNFIMLREEILRRFLNSTNVLGQVDQIKLIIPIIFDDFKLIPFTALDQAEAFALFETLNDRGLGVAAVDLIKNLCLRQGKDSIQRNQIFDKWKTIFVDDLKDLDGITFLRYSYNSRYTFITKSQLYKEYSDKIIDLMPSEMDLFLEKLTIDSKNYKFLQTEEGLKSYLDVKIKNIFKLLKSTNSTQYIVLALSVLRCLDAKLYDPGYKLLSTKSVDLLEKMHKLILTIMIQGQGMNQIERLIPDLSKKLDDKLPTHDLLKLFEDCEISIKDHILKNKLTITTAELNNLKLDTNSLSLSLLYSVMYKQLTHAKDLPQKLTLEHIFPVKYRKNEWPEIEALGEDMVESCLFNIGNHIGILQALNSEAQNKKFLEKQKIYISKNIEDFKFINTNLCIENVLLWTPEIINERKSELNDILIDYLNV